jgi:hypothetical protein
MRVCHIYVYFADPVSFCGPQLQKERHHAPPFQSTLAIVTSVNTKEMTKRNAKVLGLQLKCMFFADPEQCEAAEYGDTSAAYWKLYGAEAEICDKNLIHILVDDTKSMIIMVRGDAYHSLHTAAS